MKNCVKNLTLADISRQQLLKQGVHMTKIPYSLYLAGSLTIYWSILKSVFFFSAVAQITWKASKNKRENGDFIRRFSYSSFWVIFMHGVKMVLIPLLIREVYNVLVVMPFRLQNSPIQIGPFIVTPDLLSLSFVKMILYVSSLIKQSSETLPLDVTENIPGLVPQKQKPKMHTRIVNGTGRMIKRTGKAVINDPGQTLAIVIVGTVAVFFFKGAIIHLFLNSKNQAVESSSSGIDSHDPPSFNLWKVIKYQKGLLAGEDHDKITEYMNNPQSGAEYTQDLIDAFQGKSNTQGTNTTDSSSNPLQLINPSASIPGSPHRPNLVQRIGRGIRGFIGRR